MAKPPMAERKTLLRADEIALAPFDFRHPLDADAEIRLFGLGRMTGLRQSGVTLAHLAPGKTSFPLHRHHAEEEWIFILSGAGTLTRDDEQTTIDPGDFAAFPPGGSAHKLVNTGDETLIYLMGGSVAKVEVVDFPEAGLCLTRTGEGAGMVAKTAPEGSFTAFDFMARMKPDD